MRIEEKRLEILNFIHDNCSSVEEYVNALSKKGIKNTLSFFGVKIDYSCKLNMRVLRIILIEILKFSLEERKNKNA